MRIPRARGAPDVRPAHRRLGLEELRDRAARAVEGLADRRKPLPLA